MSLFARAPVQLPQSPQRAKLALEAALRVSEIAASAAPLPDALRAVVDAAIELLGAQQASIMLLDDAGMLTLVAAGGAPELPLGYRLVAGESVAGRVLMTGKPLRLDNVEQDAFVKFVPKDRAIASSIVVPLRVQARPIGVLSLAIVEEGLAFTDEDLRVAQMFADQAAGLIHRARLHERAEHRSSELLALLESSRGLLGTLDIEALLERVLDGGSRLTGSSDGFACLFDTETGALSRGVFRGLDKALIRDIVDAPQVVAAIDRADLELVEREEATLVAVGLRSTRGTKGLLVMRATPTAVGESGDLLRTFSQHCASAIGAAEFHGEVRRKESELSSIIHGVPTPIILVDSRFNFVAVNPAAEQLFSISGSFIEGNPVKGALDHPEIEELLMGEGNVQTEVTAGRPPQTYKVRVNDVRLPGAPIGRVLIMDDITAERNMLQAQHDFVAMIGHELRTPLTIIKGFARTLRRKLDVSPIDTTREGLATIDEKAGQLGRLIDDLMYVSRIETRQAALRIEETDISVLLGTVVDDVLSTYADREVFLDVAEGLVWPCDETKVGLVIRHLVENALKYSEPPAPVRVRAAIEGDDLRVEVIDRGIGIVSSDIPHIFERFHQIDASSTREHGGMGVGLYLCAELVRLHEGRIWVDSTWGKGSTFTFTLPRRAASASVVRMQGKKLTPAGAQDGAGSP